MTGPTKRQVERAIERLETGNITDGETGGRLVHRGMKVYAGVDFDAFPLPEAARKRVSAATDSESGAPVVAAETMAEDEEDPADVAEVLPAETVDVVGMDVEAVRAAAQRDTGRPDADGGCEH